MKIDILIPVAEKGGVENVINQVAPYLKNKGWDVRVVQLVWEGTDWTMPEIDFFPLIYGRKGHDLNEFANTYANFLKENGIPDIILATAWPYASFIAKQAAYLCEKEIYVASWLHTSISKYEEAGFGGYEAIRFADIHFAISRGIKRELEKGVGSAPVFRINNPVDISSLPRNITKSGSEKNLLYVGRLSIEKHPEVIIKAIVKSPNWTLHLVGSGKPDFERELKQLAKKLKVANRVLFHGWQENPWDVVKSADALVLASEYEGFPLSAIEANACGIPIISTPFMGVDELITPGENGFIFPFGNSDALSDILNAISNNALPEISIDNCKRRAKPFEKEIALRDFETKLKEFYNNPQKLISSIGTDKILYLEDKISIILPCYNVEKYLGKCLDSIFKQDFNKSMYEVICVNDASTDNTLNILLEYEKKYPENLLVVDCIENSKQGAARNLATYNYSSGNYIMYIDSDDYIEPGYLKCLYEAAAIYRADFSMCGYYKFDEIDARKDFQCENTFYNMKDTVIKKNFILKNGHNNSPCVKLFKKSFIQNNNITFLENTFMEDIFFFHLAMMCAESISVIPNTLYAYRINELGTMFDKKKKYERQLDIYKVTKATILELDKRHLITGFEEEYELLYYIKMFVSMLPEMSIESVDEERKELLVEIKKEVLSRFPNIFENKYINSDKSGFNTILLNYLSSL